MADPRRLYINPMPQTERLNASFAGLEVAAFESRNAKEIAALISRFGGIPRVAPSTRDVPLEENTAAIEFAEKLLAGEIDTIVFMTGVGTQALFKALATRFPLHEIVEAISQTTVIVRGPKAARAAREAGIAETVSVPEPNTWHEIIAELDRLDSSLEGRRIAVQESGGANQAFLAALAARGAQVLRVPVYRWALPEDLTPLKEVLRALIEGRARVVLFTSAVQVDHVMEVASQEGLRDAFCAALGRSVVCSIGPACSEAIAAHGIRVDLEPKPHKMGVLVNEAAKRARSLLEEMDHGARSRAAVKEAETAPSPPAWHDSAFMKACRLELTEFTPVWLMRQAGRYLKEYRDLRARKPFLDLCKDPDFVAEITIQAAERIGADAAILFADLLLIAEPMGFRLDYEHGSGPSVSPPVRAAEDIDRLIEVNVEDSLDYVFEAVRRTRSALSSQTPLIGFSGAPFTVASYLIEGGASKNFRYTKSLMYRDPGAWRALMERLVDALGKYINGQIGAGVQAVQVFDSWAGCLSPHDYREFVFPYSRRLFQQLTAGIPIIHFGVGTGALLEMMRQAGGSVIGLDAHVELDSAWKRLGPGIGVQGNLDPVVLYADPPFIRQRAARILRQAAGRPGHIFNLGHGVLPDTPVEHVIELIRAVHEESRRIKDALRADSARH